MAGMTAKNLLGKLQGIDRNYRIVMGPSKVVGLYKKQPKHPSSNAAGLRWVGAVASPSWFISLPEKDFFEANGEYHRGWKSTIKNLVEAGELTKERAKRVFGWDVLIPGIRGKLSKLHGWGELTESQKRMKEAGIDIPGVTA